MKIKLEPRELYPYHRDGVISVCDYYPNIINLGKFFIVYLEMKDAFELNSASSSVNLNLLIQKQVISFSIQRNSRNEAIEVKIGPFQIYMIGENLLAERFTIFIKDAIFNNFSNAFIDSYWQLIHVIKKLDPSLFIEIHQQAKEIFVQGFDYVPLTQLMNQTLNYWDKNWRLLLDNYEKTNKAIPLDLSGSKMAISSLYHYFNEQKIVNNGNAFFYAMKYAHVKQVSTQQEEKDTCGSIINLN